MTGRDLGALARSGARINIWATLDNGIEVADIAAEMRAVVCVNGHTVLVCATADGGEVRLPVDTEGAAALLVSTAGGRL